MPGLRPRRFVAVHAIGTVAVVCAVMGIGPSSAHAQPTDLDVQLFVPPPNVGTTFTMESTTVPSHLGTVFGIAASWARSPLVLTQTGGGEVQVVSSLIEADLLAALGLFQFMELGLAVPIVYSDHVDDVTLAMPTYSSGAGVGDLRLTLKIPLVRGAFSVAFRSVFSVPTGDGAQYTGAATWSTDPGIVAAFTSGRLTVGAKLGYRMRRRAVAPATDGPMDGSLEQDDELHFTLGGAIAIVDALSVVAEAQTRIGVGGRTVSANENPTEWDVGLRWRAAPTVTLEAGGGGPAPWSEGYGAPKPRVFVTARFTLEGDSACDEGPEDFDGYQDGDYCADPDNDSDGIDDENEACPNDAEDRDGFLDDDGCPDTDNDADGVADAGDRCPVESEDRDGFQDADGCPEPDNDEDGLADGLDECPMEPEDRDDFQDDDGCPEPGPRQATVTVTDTRILISERIYFDFDRDTIRAVSLPLLNQVAAVIRDIPATKHIRVEGHTDDTGDQRYNVDLSFRRARSVVEYLAAHGVPRDRLEYAGYGSQHQVAPNDTPEGRALNRRVEFTILEPNAPAPPQGARHGR